MVLTFPILDSCGELVNMIEIFSLTKTNCQGSLPQDESEMTSRLQMKRKSFVRNYPAFKLHVAGSFKVSLAIKGRGAESLDRHSGCHGPHPKDGGR